MVLAELCSRRHRPHFRPHPASLAVMGRRGQHRGNAGKGFVWCREAVDEASQASASTGSAVSGCERQCSPVASFPRGLRRARQDDRPGLFDRRADDNYPPVRGFDDASRKSASTPCRRREDQHGRADTGEERAWPCAWPACQRALFGDEGSAIGVCPPLAEKPPGAPGAPPSRLDAMLDATR